ncbi:hypothetical protein AGMMS50267_00620 [Spirochaetia bacterium]|nr:hypothetical protein AGMMS50267_00620 [Spirochaetia bacterium]
MIKRLPKIISALMLAALCLANTGCSGTAQGGEAGKVKRGISYNFDKGPPEADMAVLSPAVKWYYDWKIATPEAVDQAAMKYHLAHIPMAWNDVDVERLREYKKAHPEIEYLLAYNEPNLKDQANMTPAEAAEKWPHLVAVARELNLKIVSPAMNYGTMSGYSDPVKWLDDFFEQPGVSPDDISALALHCYMPNAGAVKWYIERFSKYEKPVWMTEFCAWGRDLPADFSEQGQMDFMSDVITFLELNPVVERYAWFYPRADGDNTKRPYNKLLTHTDPPELTALGKVFVNMSTCDPAVYASRGQQIEAEQFTNCNVSDWLGVKGFSRSVRYRPTTDTGGNGGGIAGGLDIYDFTQDMWVEYQVDLSKAASSLTLRSMASEAATVTISVDGAAAGTVSFSEGGWTTGTQNIPVPAGKHTIRLAVSAGNWALNWLKVK